MAKTRRSRRTSTATLGKSLTDLTARIDALNRQTEQRGDLVEAALPCYAQEGFQFRGRLLDQIEVRPDVAKSVDVPGAERILASLSPFAWPVCLALRLVSDSFKTVGAYIADT
jgi:hypothetical protein